MRLEVNEFEDFMDEVTHRFSVANAHGTLDKLLMALGWNDLLPNQSEVLQTYENGKILVLGASKVKMDDLRMTINKLGLSSDRFEFVLDYYETQTYNYRKLEYNPLYRLVLIGPVPHSSSGMGESSSVAAELTKHPDKYPRAIPLYAGGELKITKSNFKSVLADMLNEGYIAA